MKRASHIPGATQRFVILSETPFVSRRIYAIRVAHKCVAKQRGTFHRHFFATSTFFAASNSFFFAASTFG